MKLTVFQSDKGDCLLLTSADGHHMLVDGGMRASYRAHVAPALGALRDQEQVLDLVYVSHIDQDHISGVLEMMDDMVDWRVHTFQKENGNTHHKAPKVPHPPEIRAIWHNAFHEQVDKNAGPIQEMLAATATILSAANTASVLETAATNQDLATSIPEAIKLSRRIGSRQLNVPLNPEFGGKLMLVRDALPTTTVGSMSLFVIGPFQADLKKLRDDWNAWLDENTAALKQIQSRAREDEARLQGDPVARLAQAIAAQAEELGKRTNVTAPNLASLMLLVEENGKRVLLTGDGHADDIVKGLKHHGRLDGDGRLHVDVLKVQHHGSEHNIHARFCEAVTADHYIFCGNGAHENPDLRVVELVAETRLAQADGRSFKLWFNNSSTEPGKPGDQAHMRKIEQLVAQLEASSAGRLTSSFLKGHAFELTV